MAHPTHEDEAFPTDLAIIILGGLVCALIVALILQ